MPSVLVVEDDGVIARAIAAHLRHAGLDVVLAEDGDKGLRKLRYEQHDVAVVDLMLPGVDGWALTQEARREGITTPILIVSARSSEHDKVHALEIGADDYLAKPFGMRELVARVQALLRRTRRRDQASRSSHRRAGPPDRPRRPAGVPARRGRQPHRRRAHADRVPAAARRSRASQGRVLDRDELQQRVWNVPYRARDRSVDVCVRKLREKLDRRSTHSYIQTQYGVGYRFDPTPRSQRPFSPQAVLRSGILGDMATVSAAPLRIEDAAGVRTLCSTAPSAATRSRSPCCATCSPHSPRPPPIVSVHAVVVRGEGPAVLRGPRPFGDDRLLAADRARAVRHLQRR